MTEKKKIVRVKLLKSLKVGQRKYLPVGMYKQPIPAKIMELIDENSRSVVVYFDDPSPTIDPAPIIGSPAKEEIDTDDDSDDLDKEDVETADSDADATDAVEKPKKPTKSKRTRSK